MTPSKAWEPSREAAEKWEQSDRVDRSVFRPSVCELIVDSHIEGQRHGRRTLAEEVLPVLQRLEKIQISDTPSKQCPICKSDQAGHWDDCTLAALLDRLRREVGKRD